ncbi:2494_t:CDS:2 [Scutellospora calospora]|uniref:2494_t:CDS:1 n=1 Tax=Scutellospora calospora TaxID=85575 RepID=A0ACA9LKW9_9GLOM|nr:2494_t:CDS:2 [Scutellospora calospora]
MAQYTVDTTERVYTYTDLNIKNEYLDEPKVFLIKAADLENKFAEYNLGITYLSRIYSEVNRDLAMEYLMLATGKEYIKDHKLAKYYLIKSAYKGNSEVIYISNQYGWIQQIKSIKHKNRPFLPFFREDSSIFYEKWDRLLNNNQ